MINNETQVRLSIELQGRLGATASNSTSKRDRAKLFKAIRKFEKMAGIKDFKDKIVEASMEEQKPRTWEEVNAEYRASIVFHGEQMQDIDPASARTLNDALFVQDKSEECGQQIVYGEDLIQEMLTYDGMFIAFIGNEQSDNIKDKYHDCHLLLTKFHEQYEALNP